MITSCLFLCIWICFLEKERDGIRVGSWDGRATLSPTPSLVVGNVPVPCLFWKWLETPKGSRYKLLAEAARATLSTKWHHGFSLFRFLSWLTFPQVPPRTLWCQRKKNSQTEVYIRFTIAVNNFIDVVYRLPCFPVIFCTYPTGSYMEIFLWTW